MSTIRKTRLLLDVSALSQKDVLGSAFDANISRAYHAQISCSSRRAGSHPSLIVPREPTCGI